MISKIIGYLMLILTFTAYIYYTLWVYIKPFLTSENYIDKFFPDKYWAIAIPVYGATIIYTLLMIFLGFVFTFSYKKVTLEEYKKLTKSSIQRKKSQ